jgi:hypothetical protein
MKVRPALLLALFALTAAGCQAMKPENLWRLNRGPAAMNEEAYYSVPPADSAD